MTGAEKRPVVVVGAGIAGLSVALDLAPLSAIVLSPWPLGEGAATAWAQGGIAAAIGADDSPLLHAADTLTAAAGIGDPAVAERVARAAPACIERLVARGVAFDHDAGGALALGLEAAHSRRRIVHAGGDSTGAAIITALIAAARTAPSITVREGAQATAIAIAEGTAIGVHVEQGGQSQLLPASAVILATGGIGGLYAHTTNPLSAVGSGIALAARAGATLRNLEFVQFHPTAIAVGRDPMPLASEAVRGEGAILINDRAERFMADIEGAELAPRDVVARAIAREVAAGRSVFLDARAALGSRFGDRFPSIAASCRAAGIDPANDPIPVRPAAHYHMGGVAVDERGRTSVPGLWACGEVAETGLHGANRLASNSLLEALALARWIANDITGRVPLPANTVEAGAVVRPVFPTPGKRISELRQLMTHSVGVVRDNDGLARTIESLMPLAFDPAASRSLANRALVGLLIAVSAWRRTESRGGHFRSDFSAPSEPWARPATLTLDEMRALAETARPFARVGKTG